MAGGVQETFSDGEFKDDKTTPKKYNCTFSIQHQVPYLHIIFIRILDSIGNHAKHIFETDIFHTRYHRNKHLLGVFNNPSEGSSGDLDIAQEDVVDYHNKEEEKVPVMNDHKKFNTVMPILVRISNLAYTHGTKKFLKYVDELLKVETAIRRGRNILR